MSGRPLHVSIHARPADVADGPPVTVDGRQLATLRVPPEQQAEPLVVSFEQAVAALAELPRMFIEPDGSFVWVAPAGVAGAWQIDGLLIDRGERLVRVELKGVCPESCFDDLLRTLGWPRASIVVQLVQEAAFLAEPEFRRLAFG